MFQEIKVAQPLGAAEPVDNTSTQFDYTTELASMKISDLTEKRIKQQKEHNQYIDHESFFADIQQIIKDFQYIVELYNYEGLVSITTDKNGYYNVTAPGFYAYQSSGYPVRFMEGVAS